MSKKNKKLTQEEFIEKSKKLYGNRFLYDNVVYANSATNVELYCIRHQKYFKVTPSNHFTKGAGCKDCATDERRLKYSKTTEQFIEESKEKFPNQFVYDRVKYLNAYTDVEIFCITCNKYFKIPPHRHLLSPKGCPDCGWNSVKYSRRKSQEQFIKDAVELKPQYDYSKFVYVNRKTEGIVLCPKHNCEFSITPNAILTKHTNLHCPECLKEHKRKSLEQFLEEVQEIHPEYDFSKFVYETTSTKGIVICPDHGEFPATPNSLLRGHGCPDCTFSKGERKAEKTFKKLGVGFIPQKSFPDCIDKVKLRFDFYLEEWNLLVEIQGKQHYECVEHFGGMIRFLDVQRKDQIKRDYCKANNIELLEIPYWDFDKIPEILTTALNLPPKEESA